MVLKFLQGEEIPLWRDWYEEEKMYAVIETGGKQYRVSEGDIITVEKLNLEVGAKVEFDRVLVAGAGDSIQIGSPYVNTKVFGEVIENGKGKKVIIFKYKAKKDYRKKQGHRQPFTAIKITGIGSVKADAKPQAEKAVAAAKEVSMSMKKDELLAYAAEKGIAVDAKATKQVILDTINENLK